MNYYRPEDLKEALEIRAETAAKPFAGGTDLMVRYRAKNGMLPAFPGPVLYVDGIPELQGISFTRDYLELGASLPLAVIADDPGERAMYGVSRGMVASKALSAIPEVLKAAAASLGAPALRQQATMAGNIANASPAGDTVAALHALDARVVMNSVNGERILAVSDFIIGPGRTLLAANELITAIRIPTPLPEWGYWRKVGTRKANALTKISVAASCGVEVGCINRFAMAFGAAGPVIVRVSDAEKMLIGKTATDLVNVDILKLVKAIVDVSASHITPIDDQRSTAKYRKSVALNLIGEVISSLVSYLKENFT